jgi:hypothetical protein
MDITSKGNMKLNKILGIGVALLVAVSAFAQGTTIRETKFLPLLSGYNVLIPTNATPGWGVTNVLFTTYSGQVVYSKTNNSYNATVNTNLVAPDAFKLVSLPADANGNFNANAAVAIYLGNTNWIPVAVTNSVGQYFVTNWALAQSQYPNWMYPATTNLYPAFAASATNVVTVSLYRVASTTANGGSTGPTIQIAETTPSFTFTVTATGITPICVITNLPATYLQGAKQVYATVTATANSASNGNGILLNQLGVIQPQ